MATYLDIEPDPGPPKVYQIRIKGHLGPGWSDWFGGLTVMLEEDGDTLLTGPVVDQAASHGLLRKCETWACHSSRSRLLKPVRGRVICRATIEKLLEERRSSDE